MCPVTQVCKRVGLPRGTPLRAYEEVKPSPRPRLDSIVTDKPIGSHPDIQDGDIIILEQALSEVGPGTDADLGHMLVFKVVPRVQGRPVHGRRILLHCPPCVRDIALTSVRLCTVHQHALLAVKAVYRYWEHAARGDATLFPRRQSCSCEHDCLLHVLTVSETCSQAESKELACPSVTTFMQYVLMRLNVTLINLDEPKVRLRPRHLVTAGRGWTTRIDVRRRCAVVHHQLGRQS